MILIASGAYLQDEFVTEVGLLPPSFLPIGNKRAFEYQFELLRSTTLNPEDQIYLSVPESYEIDSFDRHKLEGLSVEIIYVPDRLSLCESLLYCWNASGELHTDLTLLLGDTLFLDSNFNESNVISVHPNKGLYQRASLGIANDSLSHVHNEWSSDSDLVLSGFFHFKHPLFFMKTLVQSDGSFTKAIIDYHSNYPLSLVSDGIWLDFGHINSFFHSRTCMTTQRSFNDLKIDFRRVSKASTVKSKKIFAEGNWFASLPLPLRIYTPALLDLNRGDILFNNARYSLEYLYLLPLSDLFVFCRLKNGSWKVIFQAVAELLNDFGRFSVESDSTISLDDINDFYLLKTSERLSEYLVQNNLHRSDLTYFLSDGSAINLFELADISFQFIQEAKLSDIGISHGDLCFSNMLFDSRVSSIKVIDPRGITPNGEFSIYGDKRYDLAKLYHSVIGLYDFIISGRFECNLSEDNEKIALQFYVDENLLEKIQNEFLEMVIKPSGYRESEILAITIHLFLSMLPLHADRQDRQQAFIVNALRLYEKLKRMMP